MVRVDPRRARVLALIAVLSAAALGAPIAVGGDDPAADRVAADRPPAASIADDANETDRHRQPSSYSEAADAEGMAIALERQLRRQLGEGTVELREGNYELASEYVGETFDERYAAYAELADDLDRTAIAAELDAARAELVALTETRRRYAETYEAYEDARAADDEERARELGRELEALAREINGSSGSLADHYGAIEGATDADLDESTDAAEAVGTDIRDRQAEVREAVFEPTILSVDADSAAISSAEPLSATGRLVAADGRPIGGETVRLDVGNRSLSVETAFDGSVAFSYRPISVPVSAESVTVTYVPDPESAYLRTETSVPVSIEQADPAIADPTVESNGSTVGGDGVAVGDTVTVSTSVAVDGEPVENVPLAIELGEATLDVVETDADGSIAAPATIPAGVPDGERYLTVAIPFEGRALAGSSASTPVAVRETTPDLTIETTRMDDGDIGISGSLRAADAAVADHSVAIAVDGRRMATATTDAAGRYDAVAAIPDSASGAVAVTASLDERGTNLAPAEARTTRSVPARGADGASLRRVPAWALGGSAVLAVAGVAGWHLRRRREAATGSHPAADRSFETGATGPSADASRPAPAALLARAQDAVRADRADEAVRAAYGAVRYQLGDGTGDGYTPWEFCRACDQSAAGERSLRALTEDYERAAFRPESVDGATADRALSLANALCDAAAPRRDGASNADG